MLIGGCCESQSKFSSGSTLDLALLQLNLEIRYKLIDSFSMLRRAQVYYLKTLFILIIFTTMATLHRIQFPFFSSFGSILLFSSAE